MEFDGIEFEIYEFIPSEEGFIESMKIFLSPPGQNMFKDSLINVVGCGTDFVARFNISGHNSICKRLSDEIRILC
jgi:hypothetical protein